MKKLKVLILLIVILTLLSGCARTVTQRPKGLLGIEIKFYNPLVLESNGEYYALVIAFNKGSYVSDDISTWQYFVFYDGYSKKFRWGRQGNLNTLQDFSLVSASLYGEVSENYDIFNLKIPLVLFEEALVNKIYMGMFYCTYEYLENSISDFSWSYTDLDLDLSSYPFSYQKSLPSFGIESLRIWTE